MCVYGNLLIVKKIDILSGHLWLQLSIKMMILTQGLFFS